MESTNSKWADLLHEQVPSLEGGQDVVQGGAVSWTTQIFVVITILLVVLAVVSYASSPVKLSAAQRKTPLVQAPIVSDSQEPPSSNEVIEVKQELHPSSLKKQQTSTSMIHAKRVYAKKSLIDSFNNTEEPTLTKPFESSFSEFQYAFETERNSFQTEKPVNESTKNLQKTLGPIKQAAKLAGMSTEKYVEHMRLPEDLIDAWNLDTTNNEQSYAPREENKDFENDEERILAKEAMQLVPFSRDANAIADTLREVLNARNEADKAGLKLPFFADQRKNMSDLTKHPNQIVKDLATNILSRIVE